MSAEEYEQWYETQRGRWIGQREAALLIASLAPRSGETVLDVGCGTGYFTRALAHKVDGDVMGVDIKLEWVTHAHRRDHKTASYGVADGRDLPYRDNSFDLVVSITALCFIDEEHSAIKEMVRVARRRIAIGLLNRNSLLWRKRGQHGGSGSYQGARWHTVREAKELFRGFPVQQLNVYTAIHIPTGGWFARIIERLLPKWLNTGSFILVVADIAEACTLPKNDIQRTALGTDPERFT